MPELLIAIVLGIVEGITEFLPISSTGHMLLCERLMRVDLDAPDSFWKTFTVFIQIGAILSVVVYFRGRIIELLVGKPQPRPAPFEVSLAALRGEPEPPPAAAEQAGTVDPDLADDSAVITPKQRLNALLMIAIATLPVLVVGFLVHDWIDKNLGSAKVVATALLVGGIAMILIEKIPTNITTRRIERMTWKQALGIGCAQILAAVFPGTSRSAATILGGMLAGLSRPAAAEFSFFLAIPAMFAACGFSLLKWVKHAHDTHTPISTHELLLLAIGTLISFLVAYAVIAIFMNYIKKHTFIPFAVYRIIIAVVVLLLVH